MPVVNVKDVSGEALASPEFVYIGRDPKLQDAGKGLWGNPFHIGPHGTREQVVERFRANLWQQIQAGNQSLPDLAALDGKTLVCHCAPRACHGDVLLRAASWAKDQLAAPAEELARRDFRWPASFTQWVRDRGLEGHDRVLICGPRDWRHPEVVRQVVDALPAATIVIEGEASGADRHAAKAVIERRLPLAGFPARWQPHVNTPKHRIRMGRNGLYDVAAGPIRNGNMLSCRPSRVIAMVEDPAAPSSGTADMVDQAQRAGVPVVLVDPHGVEYPVAAGEPSP